MSSRHIRRLLLACAFASSLAAAVCARAAEYAGEPYRAGYDDAHVYFFAQTAAPITPHTDPKWMLLFIDADQDAETGWSGYDFAVNLEVTSPAQTTLKAWRNGRWETADTIAYHVNGNGLELALPRSLAGEAGRPPAFDFHWADNPQSLDGVEAFAVDGDSAPNRRANYRFEVGR